MRKSYRRLEDPRQSAELLGDPSRCVHFAAVVDCGKGFAREIDAPTRASDAFVGLVSQTLGRRFYEVGDDY